MPKVSTDVKILIAGGLVLAAVVYYALKNAKSVGAAVGAAAVDLPVGIVTGAASAAFGIPSTNLSQCELAKKQGDTWGASKYCDASTFIRYLTTGA